ncbi:BatD family protein [Pseudomonas sp. LRF_L74]|uniref:BatD family protein n=1 Tax=Pseudomonas sp. LRF_L74 TaxID=3369422 RepID=UPI003F63A6E9
MTRLFCALLLSLLALHASAQTLTASVDREHLGEGESLELTLQSDDATVFGKPDLAPLQPQFDILSTRQENNLSTYGGRSQATTRWIITLMPKQSGFVIIPPLKLGEASSQPIKLEITQANAQRGSDKLAPIFIDASLDAESVYVQAQAQLTLRIYSSPDLTISDRSLTQLLMPDARIEQLGEPDNYRKTLNGTPYDVIELHYSIFPQKSGRLTIPSQTFSANVMQSAPANDLYNPFSPRYGRMHQVKSPEIPLTVKAKPADYPADAPWLPASSLSLSESWSPEPDKVRTGDSLTRSVTLRAEGLSSAQLPPLPTSQADGLRRYPDQPKLSNESKERSIIGIREDREALVPSRSGRIELPELQVVWWNTQQDKLERTSLPARTLEVAENPALVAEAPVETAPATVVEGPPLWPWQLACLVLTLTTLLGFGLWWHARRQPAILPTAQSGPSPRTLLDDLKRACQANDTQATRQALDAWARQQPETLADMAARFAPLSEALDGLNGSLYSETGQHWQGTQLWEAIRTLPPLETPQHQSEPSPLPPLYPR